MNKEHDQFRADMHCHSTCSDGSLTPEELIVLAKKEGLKALSITDHDSIEAYQTATPAAIQHGITLVSGAEFSSIDGNDSIHILAYSFSLENPVMHAFCAKHQLRRIERNREILRLLDKAGMPIDEAELLSLAGNASQPTSIGRPHIAHLMVQKGFVANIREAFNKYIGEGCRCYAQGNFFSPQDTVDIIHQANGFALIAHPHLIQNDKAVLKLLKMNFDGIECYYSKFHAHAHERWLKIVKQRNWILSGGSDFHGSIKPLVPLGCSWIDEQNFNIFLNRFVENQK